jgi:hypothetical protein
LLNVISGLLSGAGAPASTNSYESISTVTLGSSQATIAFSSIPSTYKHLQIRGTYFNTGLSDIYFKLNTNTGLKGHGWDGAGISTGSSFANAPGANGVNLDSGQWNTGYPTTLIVDIYDYQNTNK